MLGGSRRLRIFLLTIAAALLAVVVLLQVQSIVATQRVVEAALQLPPGRDSTDLDRERIRQEAIAKRIENESKALLWSNLGTGVAATLGLLLSIGGALGTAFAYFQTRRKEREDRLAAALNETLTRLASNDARQRTVGAVGLIYFFTPERREFHQQALQQLINAARSEPDENVRQSLRVAIEHGMRSTEHAQLRTLSWQGLKLPGLNLAGCDLSGLDFRDVVLENANLSGTRLIGTDLRSAKLWGANLAGANLAGVDLTNAELDGVSLRSADFPNGAIDGVRLLNVDVEGTKFGEGVTGWRELPWEAALNWRRAKFDPSVRAELDLRYGGEAPDLRVLMLVWEMPPTFVAGGTWTACYHLVRKLRQRGANLTVVTPWRRDAIADLPFGIDVPVVALGIEPEARQATPYGAAGWSPYGGASAAPDWSPYSGFGWSPYEGAAGSPSGMPAWSPYGPAAAGGEWTPPSPYGWSAPGNGWSPYGGAGGVYGDSGAHPALAESTLFRLMNEFRRRLLRYLAGQSFDLIHAHDWVTFEAARDAASAHEIPWIAHFHSTDPERQPENKNAGAGLIESTAVLFADRIIAPSRATAKVLVTASKYSADASKIYIAPNLLSDRGPPTFDMGRFESKRVLFLGRLSAQKGVDLFFAAAEKARAQLLGPARERFRAVVVGSGEEEWRIPDWDWLEHRGALAWDERSRAFRDASVVVVPSRFEPFGMVILEAMQHRVPVLYPQTAGAAEVLDRGIRIDPHDSDAVAAQIAELLTDITTWESTVQDQAIEIDAYPARRFEDLVIAAWKAATGAAAPGDAAPVTAAEFLPSLSDSLVAEPSFSPSGVIE